MRQLVYAMFITNNHASFYLWWKKLVKYQKVLKYYAYDCISLNFCSSNNLRQQQYITTKFVCILRFGLKLLRGFSNSDSKLLMRWEGRQNSWGIGFFALLENQFWFAGNLNKSCLALDWMYTLKKVRWFLFHIHMEFSISPLRSWLCRWKKIVLITWFLDGICFCFWCSS